MAGAPGDNAAQLLGGFEVEDGFGGAVHFEQVERAAATLRAMVDLPPQELQMTATLVMVVPVDIRYGCVGPLALMYASRLAALYHERGVWPCGHTWRQAMCEA
jgi:hypothetical protein